MNDYRADEALAESLLPLSPEEILRKIFERYPVKCIELGKLFCARYNNPRPELKGRRAFYNRHKGALI